MSYLPFANPTVNYRKPDEKAIQKASGSPPADQLGNSDEAVHWWAPFGERIAKWGYGGEVEYTNVDWTTLRAHSGPLTRNALDAGVFAAVQGLVAEAIINRLKMPEMLKKASGAGVAVAVAAKGFDLKERIVCTLVDTHRWYGRYRYQPFDEKPLAVEYWGKEDTKVAPVKPVILQQVIVDANNNELFRRDFELKLGIPSDSKTTTLPLSSFGKVDD